MILSAKSCCAHSGALARRVAGPEPARTPQNWPGQAEPSWSRNAGFCSPNRRGLSKTGFLFLSGQRMRPKATSGMKNADNTTSVTTRGAQLFRIANDSTSKQSRNKGILERMWEKSEFCVGSDGRDAWSKE